LAPGKRALIPTGVRLRIPPGYEGQIRSRSGLAANAGVLVLNSPGTIDSDYRGEVKVILANLGDQDFPVAPGDRVAQLVFAAVAQVELVPEIISSESGRGSGGFGHTGIK
jgi:dUTP pyrophosphatase